MPQSSWRLRAPRRAPPPKAKAEAKGKAATGTPVDKAKKSVRAYYQDLDHILKLVFGSSLAALQAPAVPLKPAVEPTSLPTLVMWQDEAPVGFCLEVVLGFSFQTTLIYIYSQWRNYNVDLGVQATGFQVAATLQGPFPCFGLQPPRSWPSLPPAFDQDASRSGSTL